MRGSLYSVRQAELPCLVYLSFVDECVCIYIYIHHNHRQSVCQLSLRIVTASQLHCQRIECLYAHSHSVPHIISCYDSVLERVNIIEHKTLVCTSGNTNIDWTGQVLQSRDYVKPCDCSFSNCLYFQGRRHGFESGGTILRAERAKKFFGPPTFWPVGGTKYCLDS